MKPKDRLLAAIDEGATVPCHACSAKPIGAEGIAAVSLGSGLFDATGGSFTVKLPGKATCIVLAWEGYAVVFVPGQFPLSVEAGQVVKLSVLG